MSSPITYLNTSGVDHNLVLRLVEASIQAYNIFNKDNPTECDSGKVTLTGYLADYDFVECWTGVDAVFNHLKTVETYGVVLRSKQQPYSYIFAFRGTDSSEDLLDDFAFDHTDFVPYRSGVTVPSDVKVESGFYRIYSDLDGETPSMQQQVFALVDKYQNSKQPIDTLYITGHSLGCTLATLFALDMALSRPQIKAINYNYASPRVGNAAFVSFYDQQLAQQSPKTCTLRIQNVYDKVPCVPLEVQGYQHLPYAYLVAFYRDNLTGKFDIVDNHSVRNYKTVLQCAFSSADGLCEETFEYDDNGTNKKMKSVKPDSAAVCTHW
jgi:hypothetical protein